MLALRSNIGKWYVTLSILISLAAILLILTVLLIESWPAISFANLNLFSFKWSPETNEFGMLSMLYGTVSVTFIALLLSSFIGISTAIFTSEILPSKYRFPVKSLLEILAGIPSIIYGLIGVAVLSIWVQDLFDLQSGRTILTAGILLAIMILPTIITLVDDSLNQVPIKYKEASTGLGQYKYQTIFNVVLPIAKQNIIGAILLAFGRALGETMAVMLVIGSIDKIPTPFFNFLNPGQTITSKLGREIAEASFGSVHFSAMIFMGLLLLVIVLIITFIAQRKLKTDRLYE